MAMYGMPDLFISTSSRDKETVDWLNGLFLDAVNQGASDVHFEDMEVDTRVRFRVNGMLLTVDTVPRMRGVDGINKIRARADLPLSELRKPLDGRFSLHYKRRGTGISGSVVSGSSGTAGTGSGEPGTGSGKPSESISIDVRASFTPIIHGTSLVCRVLDQRNTLRTIDQIEMTDEVRKWVSILLREPHGLFIVSGPTGSGKTSTLYALLNALRDDTRKISTIEDPVEYRVAGLCQTNIEGNLTFADVLRAELRQDPDVILVGEIRDAETAQIALQAANTGHLVLSTLHSNDAAGSVGRLLDLGVDPNTLGAALRGVLAQRLVRRLAPAHETAPPSEAELFWLTNHDIEVAADTAFGVPIETEGDMGYEGRVPVMELIVVDRTVRNILPLKDAKAIRTVARRQPQYQTLAAAAAALAQRGLTSLSEAFTVSSLSEHLRSLRTLPERLIELGKLTPYQYDICKHAQQEASRMGRRMTLEEVLIAKQYVSQTDIDDVTDL